MGRHAAPAVKRSVTKPIILATAAIVAAAALIGGPGTIAYLTASAAQPTQQIAAGGLGLTVAKTTDWVATGASISSTVVKTTNGLIPGLRNQKITFTVTNNASSAVYGKLSGTLTAPKSTNWTTLESMGLITYTTAGDSNCQLGAVTSTSTSLSFPVSSTTPLAPGVSCGVSVTLSIPAIGSGGQDAAMSLKAMRLASVADFTLNVTLTQAARQEVN